MLICIPKIFQFGFYFEDRKNKNVTITFYDGFLDDLTVKTLKENSFGGYNVYISMHELPKYTNLKICYQKNVELVLGRWQTNKDATDFLLYWLKYLRPLIPTSILANWYSYLNETESEFYLYTEKNNERNFESPITIPRKNTNGRIEQPDNEWRDGRSYYARLCRA